MYGRTVGLWEPKDIKSSQWFGGFTARDTGREMQKAAESMDAHENAYYQNMANRQAEADQMARQQYQQQVANQRAQYDAFQAEEKRKQELHAKSMKERPSAHDLFKQQTLMRTQNEPAMAMVEQFGNVFGQQPKVPDINLQDHTGKRIGGSSSGGMHGGGRFGPFKKSLMG